MKDIWIWSMYLTCWHFVYTDCNITKLTACPPRVNVLFMCSHKYCVLIKDTNLEVDPSTYNYHRVISWLVPNGRRDWCVWTLYICSLSASFTLLQQQSDSLYTPILGWYCTCDHASSGQLHVFTSVYKWHTHYSSTRIKLVMFLLHQCNGSWMLFKVNRHLVVYNVNLLLAIFIW